MLVNQWIQFAVTTPFQEAVARALDDADQPYEGYPKCVLGGEGSTGHSALLCPAQSPSLLAPRPAAPVQLL